MCREDALFTSPTDRERIMTSFGIIASSSIRSRFAAPLCGAVLALGCGNGASDPSGAASPSHAGRGPTESNQMSDGQPSDALSAETKQSRVVGYLPTYRFAANPPLHLETLTHLNLAFASPDSDGKVVFANTDSKDIQQIVLQAHAAKVKVLVALGGGGKGGKDTTDALDMPANTVVSSLLELVEHYDLDGVDVDIEGENIHPKTYGPLMQTLSKQLAPKHKLLTAAVAEDHKSNYRVLGAADFLNIMSYDQCGGWSPRACEHSTLAQAQVDLENWSSVQDVDADGVLRTIGANNVVLGVPFYGRCWGEKCPGRVPKGDGTYEKTVDLSYAGILAYCAGGTFSGCSQSTDVLKSGDEFTGYYVSLNSPATIKRKTEKAMAYGGIMIWELGQDDSSASLFAEIANAYPKSTRDTE